MDPLSYFETVTSKSALNRHKYPPLHQRNILPAASGWGRRELFESRVVVGGSRHNVLPYRASSSEGFRGAETPKVRSLRGTEGAGDEGQGASQAAEALAVPIASYRVHCTYYKPRIHKNLVFG